MSNHFCNTCIKLPKLEPILGNAITISRSHSYHCGECGREFMYCCKVCKTNMRAVDNSKENLHESDRGLFCSRKCVDDWIDAVTDQGLEDQINSEQ